MESTIINGERIRLKHSNIFGWKVVHPIKNEDGKFNFVNFLFGGKGNLIVLIILMAITAMFFTGINQMFESCSDFADHPCDYIDCCLNCSLSDINNNAKNISMHLLFVDSFEAEG